MTTRRNSSQGFGTVRSDEYRRSSRSGNRQSQGRNYDEYESDYEDYDDDEDEDDYRANRNVSSRRNQ